MDKRRWWMLGAVCCVILANPCALTAQAAQGPAPDQPAARAESSAEGVPAQHVIAAGRQSNHATIQLSAASIRGAGGDSQPTPEQEEAAAAQPIPVSGWNLLFIALAVVGVWLFFNRGWYRLDAARPPPERPQFFRPQVGFGLFVGAIILARLGQLAGVFVLEIDPAQIELREIVLVALSRYGFEALIIAAFAWLLLRSPRPERDRRAGVAGSILLALVGLGLFWVFVIALTFAINVLIRSLTDQPPDPIAHETLAMLTQEDRTVWFFAMVGLVLIVAPIFEEVIYRGILQHALVQLELSRWLAIVITSVVFTVMHIPAAPSPEALPPMLVALFVLSLGFGWVYEKTGRLAAPIVMHMLFNAGNLAAAMWMTSLA